MSYSLRQACGTLLGRRLGRFAAAAWFAPVACVGSASADTDTDADPAPCLAGSRTCGAADALDPAVALGPTGARFAALAPGQTLDIVIGPQGFPMVLLDVRIAGLDATSTAGTLALSRGPGTPSSSHLRPTFFTCDEPGFALATDVLLVVGNAVPPPGVTPGTLVAQVDDSCGRQAYARIDVHLRAQAGAR